MPAWVIVPPGIRTSRRSFADTRTSSRSRSTWLDLDFRMPSNTFFATGPKSGWATHVPSKPSFASRILSSRTFASAISFASGPFRLGMHAAVRDAEGLLREPEHLVPEASLQMALHLRQVEVRAGPAGSKLLRVVEEVEPEVHQAPRDRYAVDDHVLLRQVPTTGPNQKGRGLPVQTVFLSFGTRELQGPPHRVEQVQLALDDVPPRGRVRVLEIGHEHLGARVQGIDHHLPIGRPGDLDLSIVQVRGKRSNLPRPLTDRGRLRKEFEHVAAIDPNLALCAAMQEILTRPIEVAMQVREERESFAGEDR